MSNLIAERLKSRSWETRYGYPPLFGRKRLLQLLWPLVVEQLLAVFVGMVDVLMVASLGEAAVSGVALVDSLNNLTIQVLFAITAGGTVVCAQFVGAGNKREAGRTGGQLVLMTTVFEILVMILCIAGRGPILHLMFGGVEPDVMANALTYLAVTALSFPFLAVYNSGASIFRASGNTKVSMQVSLMMNLLNIAGNAICIFGLGMGVLGVAIPTFLSRAFAAVTIMILLQNKENEVRIRSLTDLKPDTKIMRRILAIGIPNGVESGLFQLGKVMLQSLVSTLGTASIAAFAVASNLVPYLYLPGNALGAAMITVVGQCYGADDKEQARFYMKKLVILNYVMLSVICTVLLIGNRFFVGCYRLTPESAPLAEGLVFIHTVAMVIWPLGFLIPYYFRASGHAALTMAIAVFAMWTFRIGLAYVNIRVLHMNVLGIWYAMFVDWIFRVAVYLILLHREKHKMENRPADV
ncbi:MAG: MATE family efflux transporter [Blautia sp.]|nr:MATE family efflux transporter [Blautia sp.]